MTEIYKLLPEIFFNIIGGYIFICIFRYVSYLEKLTDINNILLSSLVIGFSIEKLLVQLVKCENKLIYLLICCILALLLGKFSVSKLYEELSKKLKINRSRNKQIWNDFVDLKSKNILLKLIDSKNKIYYEGYCIAIEELERQPIIVLKKFYKAKTDNNNILVDNRHNDISILLNTQIFDVIERIPKTDE